MVRCAKSRIELPEDYSGDPCPKCGSSERSMVKVVNEKLGIIERLWGRGRGYRIRKKRLSTDMFVGHNFHKKTGKWNMIFRLFDRINDWYVEKISDPDTGEIIKDGNYSSLWPCVSSMNGGCLP